MDHRNHVSRVLSALQRTGNLAIAEQGHNWRANEASWRRCIEHHRLDPSSRPQPPVLTERELRQETIRLDSTLRIASEEIDRLYAAVHVAGYAAAFSNEAGVMVSERADRRSPYYASSDRPGSRWLEDECGTNGVGTCLVERRPVAVFLNDHFFADYTTQSCVAVPVYGAEADPIGALNVSTLNPVLQEATHQVIFGITVALAERLDERLFRHRFRNHHMLRLASPETGGRAALLAVDSDHQIIGVNHVASELLGRDQLPTGRSIWSFFEKDDRLLTQDTRDFGRIDLRTQGTGTVITASARPPVSRPSPRPVPTASARVALARPQSRIPSLDDCAGNDRRMIANIRLIRRTMQSQLPLLLLGETGVGKDTLARAIHMESGRAAKPYVAFSCAAVPDTLIDSELFGYGGGAFTGAKREGSTGRLMEANGGTLFLDEIGDMPLMLQTRLLRVLESGEVKPLGSSKVLQVDLQVIAATHQDLEQRIAEGTFREDLYYRLAGVVVHVPALRDRDDLDLMIARALEHFAAGRPSSLEPGALAMLRAYQWPGNVRELRHVVHRAVQLCDDGLIRTDDLLLSPQPPRRGAPLPLSRPPEAEGGTPTARDAVAAAERIAIDNALRHSSGSIDKCAVALGVSRATLYRKLRRHRLHS